MLLRVLNYPELTLDELPAVATAGARNGVVIDDARAGAPAAVDVDAPGSAPPTPLFPRAAAPAGRGSGDPAMIERELLIANKLGLHARATAKLVQTLAPYRCNATLTAKGREVNAKSIMGVMLLAAGHGTPVMLRVEGEDEAAAVDALVALFERRFDEEN